MYKFPSKLLVKGKVITQLVPHSRQMIFIKNWDVPREECPTYYPAHSLPNVHMSIYRSGGIWRIQIDTPVGHLCPYKHDKEKQNTPIGTYGGEIEICEL